MIGAAAVVTSFIRAIERKDLDAGIAMLAPDVSYENVPIDPIVGRQMVRAVLESFLAAAGEVDWAVSRQIEAGSTVFNERVDRFRLSGGWLELPVAGVFEVNDDGLITLWRDYFDMGSYQRQLAELSAA